MKVVLSILIIIVAVNGFVASQNTVKLVHVFFRHGARTPELKDVYSNDPYTAKDFLPMGYGALTNKGKQESFKLGLKLRELYNEFLGDIYYPEMLEANSTDYDRTKMTLLLVLAGLFKPEKKQIWNDNLNWMPIPINYEKHDLDYTLRRPIHFCPTYVRELEKVMASKDIQAEIQPQRELFEYIQKHTNRTINTPNDVLGVYQTLNAEDSMQLTLPQWAQTVYPEKIKNVAAKVCHYENYVPILKRLNGGRMLGIAIKQMIAKSEGKVDKKIYLYSGHENNVLNILAAVDVFQPHVPKYASAVIIELHHSIETNAYGVKVLYVKDLDQVPEEKQLKGCDVLCPLDKFIEITKPHVPVNYTAECNSNINLD